MRRSLLCVLAVLCLAAGVRVIADRDDAIRLSAFTASVTRIARAHAVQPGVTQPMAAAAYSSSLLLKPDGTLWSWGANGYGQLGDGSTTTRLQPIDVSTLSDVRYVSGGHGNTSTFALAVTGDGALYAWGNNAAGQLGDGTTTSRLSPAVVSGLSSVIQAKAGEYYTTALKSDGTVWSWGSNGFGQLGNGGYTSTTTPVQTTITGVVAISSWSAFTLALKSDGTVWGWGTDYSGELGDGGSNTNRPSPVRTLNLTNVVAIANGWIHGLAVKSDGTVWTWGRNVNGQLGDGTFTNRSAPVQVSGLTAATAAAGGENHSLALKSDGTVWAWGDNSRGELGDGTTTTRTTPVQVSGLTNVIAIAAGTNSSIAVNADGVVYAWGANNVGQVGDGTTADRLLPTAISEANYLWKTPTPTLSVATGTYNSVQTVTVNDALSGVDLHYTLSGADPTQADPGVVAGAAVTVDATETLKVSGWKSGYAQSNVAQAAYVLTPVTPLFSPAGGTFTAPQNVAITTATGQTEIRYTADGTIPTPSSTLYTGPVAVGTSTTLKAMALRTSWTNSAVASGTFTMNFGTLPTPTISPAAGTYTSSAEITLGSIAGATLRYTLNGTDPTTASTIYTGPFSVTASATLKVKAWHPDYAASPVASGAYTIVVAAPTLLPTSGAYPAGQAITVATATAGATITYTLNGVDPLQSSASVASGGTLVAGNYTLKAKAWKTGATPSAVTTATYLITGEFVPASVTAGSLNSIAVSPDGTVWAWGDNTRGAVGDGTNVTRLNPTRVVGLTGARSVSEGYYHSVALLADGSVRAWGQNPNGEVGDGTVSDRWTPTRVLNLADAMAIDAGLYHTIALRSDGTVVTWGYNAQGQLGDGTTTNRTQPVAVTGLTSVSAVSAGTDHTLVLKSDGTVWAWGDNAKGQLGDGTVTRRLAPVQVSGLTDVVAVHAGNTASLAVKSDGTVWTWGWNGYGQLGDGTTTNRTAPVQMLSVTGAIAAGMGWQHATVLTSNGSVWAVGDNSLGQLGIPGGNRSTVAQVSGLPAITRIGVGDVNVWAVSADAAAWTWGRNQYASAGGAIGDGTMTNRGTPWPIAGPGLVWRPWIPVIGIAAGQYSVEQYPIVSNADPSAVMHYSLTGIDPTESDPVVSAATNVAITQSATLKVKSFKAGAPPSEVGAAAYTLKVVLPSFSPLGGTYATAQSVTLSTTTGSADIRYTTDGTMPASYSAVYSGALAITQPTIVRAYAARTGWTASDVAAASYWVSPVNTLGAPTIAPGTGTYGLERVVTISAPDSDATVRYTTDGSDPTADSPVYQRPFAVTQTLTVKARAFKVASLASPVATATLTMVAANVSGAPTIAPAGGQYTTQRTITITGPAGATLHYTTTGEDPSDTDPVIASGATLTVDRSMVVKVRAWQAGMGPSAVRREDYVITGAISAGQTFSIALKADGTVWTWGYDWYGQLGDGGAGIRTAPFQVLSGAVAVSGGNDYALALKSDGTVWSWGNNAWGALGDGTYTTRRSPIQVLGLSEVIAIAAGDGDSYALKSDGTVWAWGSNIYGQLGDGTLTWHAAPIKIPGLSGVSAIAADGQFGLALVTDGASGGQVWAWGRNDAGQLGDGTTINRSVPQPVPQVSSAISLLAGHAFAGARTSDGELLLWGANDTGQMSIGVRDGTLKLRATLAAPWTGALSQAAAGYRHVLALARDGRLWGWGDDCDSQLAFPGCTWFVNGEQLTNFTQAADVSGGISHTLAIARDGHVWAWGANNSGQLGNGTTTSSSMPVQASGLSVADNSWLTQDPDNDGLSTWQEYQFGTDPLSADTDGDGIPDAIDIAGGGGVGNNLDPDGDGLSNAIERLLGTDPYNADVDGDGVSDSVDAYPLDPTRSQPPPPDPNDHTPPIITLTYPVNARPSGGGH